MSTENNSDKAFDTSSLSVTAAYIFMLLPCALVLFVLSYFWGDTLPLAFTDITTGGVMVAGLGKVWPIFAWAMVATIVLTMIDGIHRALDSRLVRLIKGVWLSLNAGVFEELIFRWLLFFSAMIALPFLNFITFGLVKFIYTQVLIPLVNFITLGILDAQLTGSSWVIGAAIISVNADFRDGHAGFIGTVNSWFIGMVMFYLVFNYNLQTAIVAHVVYDIVVFSISAVAIKGSWSNGYTPVVWNTGWDKQ